LEISYKIGLRSSPKNYTELLKYEADECYTGLNHYSQFITPIGIKNIKGYGSAFLPFQHILRIIEYVSGLEGLLEMSFAPTPHGWYEDLWIEAITGWRTRSLIGISINENFG
jgi:hypothetical protein